MWAEWAFKRNPVIYTFQCLNPTNIETRGCCLGRFLFLCVRVCLPYYPFSSRNKIIIILHLPQERHVVAKNIFIYLHAYSGITSNVGCRHSYRNRCLSVWWNGIMWMKGGEILSHIWIVRMMCLSSGCTGEIFFAFSMVDNSILFYLYSGRSHISTVRSWPNM